MDLLMFRKRGKQLDYTRQSYCFFCQNSSSDWTTQLLERHRTPAMRSKLEDSCNTRFFLQGFAIRETAAQLSNVGSVCDPPCGHAEIKNSNVRPGRPCTLVQGHQITSPVWSIFFHFGSCFSGT